MQWNGEMEAIWLATANGELRSEVLALKQALACWDVVFEMIPKRDSDLGRLKHDVVADEIVRLRAEVADLHNGINWQTTCLHCAKLLDDNYVQYCEIERLRAAGDAFTEWWTFGDIENLDEFIAAVAAWQEARRG